MPATHLLLFSRAPVAGATKTRLATVVGDAAARDFHVACLLDIADEAKAWAGEAPGRIVHAFITPPGSGTAFTLAGVRWPDTFRLHNQAGETLGQRMHDALSRVLRAAPGSAVLVATDLPLLRREVFTATAEALAAADVVFGPAPDGGYSLVGLKRPQPALFDGYEWGSSTVLAESLEATSRAGLRVAQVAALPDVDVVADIPGVLGHPDAATLANRRAMRVLQTWVAEGLVPGPG
ncbi:MAG TPA: TIGR04282 family arsenosugar biosynthesis glycosyltransferase [bacterium]